jgi:hypothetical protein
MSTNVISIHPYFKVKPGKQDALKGVLATIVKAVATEKKCVYFDFTINDDTVFCREAYAGVDGVMEHVANVGPLLPQLFAVSDLTRIEVHGAAADIEKLKTGPLAGLKPTWFAHIDGVAR